MQKGAAGKLMRTVDFGSVEKGEPKGQDGKTHFGRSGLERERYSGNGDKAISYPWLRRNFNGCGGDGRRSVKENALLPIRDEGGPHEWGYRRSREAMGCRCR